MIARLHMYVTVADTSDALSHMTFAASSFDELDEARASGMLQDTDSTGDVLSRISYCV